MASRAAAGPALAALAVLLPALAGCVGPAADGDGDGLDDATEASPREVRIRTANGTEVRFVGSDPALRDTDGDGLDDFDEVNALTDPRDPDTDGDGLLDGHDLDVPPGSPLQALLLARGVVLDPDRGRFLGEAEARTKPFDWDGDRPFPDGLGDGDELRGWEVNLTSRTYRVRSDPTVPDTDRDNLNDLEERARGCDPHVPDTDGDGVPDAVDADCTRDVWLSVAVGSLDLARALDPAGDTDLQLVVQAAGQDRTHTQALRVGPNEVTFQWVLDIPDQGPWRQLSVPVVMAFWDLDMAGDDDRSGVQRQPICVVPRNDPCNVLSLRLDVAQRRWTADDGASGTLSGATTGADATARFTLLPLLR